MSNDRAPMVVTELCVRMGPRARAAGSAAQNDNLARDQELFERATAREISADED